MWSFFTYALLHADWMHFGFNAVWLLAFASPVARRFGAARFLMFFAVTVAAGALAYLLAHAGALAPMIGASAGISGMMGAAARFAFEPGGSLDMWHARSRQLPTSSLPRRFLLHCAIRASSRLSACGSASTCCSGSGRCRWWPATIRASRGRPMSAAFSPACCCFRCSIRRRPPPVVER